MAATAKIHDQAQANDETKSGVILIFITIGGLTNLIFFFGEIFLNLELRIAQEETS